MGMNKSMYSLMLSDDVVDAIDRLALRQNTNRSNLVNRILAEYCGHVTPEMQVQSLYRQITDLLEQSGALIADPASRGNALSFKSSLDYRYRPTIRYEVALTSEGDRLRGVLSVILRTQSAGLLQAATAYFTCLKRCEDAMVLRGTPAKWEYGEGRFYRSFTVDTGNSAGLGDAISAYVSLIDSGLKDFVASRADSGEIARRYEQYLKSANIIL